MALTLLYVNRVRVLNEFSLSSNDTMYDPNKWCPMNILGSQFDGVYCRLNEVIEQECPPGFNINGSKFTYLYDNIDFR